MGYEGAIAGSALGRTFDAKQRLDQDMVLGIQGFLAGTAGGYYVLETVQITANGPRVLSRMSHGPLAGEEQ
jgi:hypothetical protein